MFKARSIGKLALAATVAFSNLAISPGMQARDDVMPMHTTVSINVANMDKSSPPCQDFYQYANGTWLKNTPIPADYASWGTFHIIEERNLKLLRKIMEEAANQKDPQPGSNEQKIGDFYATGMDEKKIEADGIKPLQSELDRINAIKNIDDLRAEITRLHEFGINVGFGYGSGQDFKDSTKVIAQASQHGLGLPDRDYYTNTDANSKKIREQYLTHVAKMFVLLGDDQTAADSKAKQVMAFETKLAEASMKNTDMRDPEKIYHKMTIAQLNDLTPHFDWNKYDADLGFPSINEINVGQPDFFKQFDAEIASRPLDAWKTYLTFHLVSDTAAYLSNKFVEEEFDFDGRILQGKKENLPRWKRVIHTADSEVGQPLGQLYVKAAFSPEAKARALDMVQRLKAVLRDEITKLDWMGADTKKNAIAKLDAFSQKIGYPDKWRDYSGLKIDRDSYVWNVLRGEQFEFKRQLEKIGKPVDRTDWLMNPQEVNAYYQAEMNEIVFPAGILQPPFFDAQADDAANFGSMGMIIGHEMTHGFDDEGSKFDGAGNMKDWWTEEDKKRFQERVDLIVNQFNGYTVAADTKVKGKLVSGEAAADLGGLTIAYKALERSLEGKPRTTDPNGFTAEQRFFISFAQGWAQNTRLERERLMANTNPHPTPKLRVNGTLANMDAFATTFNCAKDCQMMLSPEKRCHLW
jgi:putative endopeptidase